MDRCDGVGEKKHSRKFLTRKGQQRGGSSSAQLILIAEITHAQNISLPTKRRGRSLRRRGNSSKSSWLAKSVWKIS